MEVLKNSYKPTISLIIICVLSLSIFHGKVNAFEDHTEHSNTINWPTTSGNHKIYAASSIGYVGASWNQQRGRWTFTYRFAGTGATRDANGNNFNRIRIARMDIRGTQNVNNKELHTIVDPLYIGSAPRDSGPNPNYSNVALTIVGFAITAINKLGVSYFWSVASLIGLLRHNVDANTTDSNRLLRQWNWTQSDVANTGQFFWFFVDVRPNQSVQISHEYLILGPGYEILSAGKGLRNLNAGANPNSRALSEELKSDWNPGMMSEIEKEQYGIEEIPRKDFEKRAKELEMPSEIVNDLLESKEDTFYFAHNFEEHAALENEKQDMSNSYQSELEKVNTIIDAFSLIEEKSEEDREIIRKNEEKKYYFENLLRKIPAYNYEK